MSKITNGGLTRSGKAVTVC